MEYVQVTVRRQSTHFRAQIRLDPSMILSEQESMASMAQV